MHVATGSLKIYYGQTILKENAQILSRLLFITAMVNLFIVSVLGIVLRAFPFFSFFPLTYKNLLHGHSHFAFGGWLMPAILALLLKCFPEIGKAVQYKHWRNISFLLLFSAYGMLIFFPLQGYRALSIVFSSLSIGSGFYLAVTVWKVLPLLKPSVSFQFLKAGLFYMVLSSFGPLATGPLIALGKSGTPVYFDVIYFYLHFQYNGWFLFAVLALFYKYLEEKRIETNSRRVYQLLNLACIPTYFLSVLWHQPSLIFNVVAASGAVVQCVALIYLFQDLRLFKFENKLATILVKFPFASVVLKILLQLLSALPAVAVLAYNYRNFVIAYLHLVLLGCVSLFLIGWGLKSFDVANNKALRTGIAIFVIGFVCMELFLIAAPLSSMINYTIPFYNLLLLTLSILLPLGIALVAWSFFRSTGFYPAYPSNIIKA